MSNCAPVQNLTCTQARKDGNLVKQEGERAFQENQVLQRGLELIGSTPTEKTS